MRIALYHNLTSGGSKREAYEFARQLAHAGHTVHLFRPSTANERFLPLTEFVERDFVFDLHFLPDLPLRFPGLTRYLDLAALLLNLARLRRTAKQIAHAIDSDTFDFAFVHHDPIVQSPCLLRYIKTKSVYYCAEPMREFYEPPIRRPYQFPRSPLDRAQHTWYAPERALRAAVVKSADCSNIQCATLLLTNSDYSADSIKRAYQLPARVSYLGVDVEKFQAMNLPRENFVLSVGAVAPLKGYDFLLQAVSQISAPQRPRLVIVGNTASAGETNFLRRLAEQSEVTLDIRVGVEEQELVCLYNKARALVYAPIREPFGLAPLEAMACGTPVIAVNEGGVRESVADGETGFLVDREASVFAEALNRVLGDASLALRLGSRGREIALDKWTWEMAYERMMQNLAAAKMIRV